MATELEQSNIPYPDFQNGSVITESEFDSNNDELQTKLNLAIAQVNVNSASVETGDGALTTHKSSDDHDGRYYTESEIDAQNVIIQADIDQNETDSDDADVVLQANIDAEASARATADNDLQVRIDANDAAAVHKTGDETIAGVKTLTSSPIIPSGAIGGEAINYNQTSDMVDDAMLGTPTSAEYGAMTAILDSILTAPLSQGLTTFKMLGITINQMADNSSDFANWTATDFTVEDGFQVYTDDGATIQEGTVPTTLSDNTLYSIISYIVENSLQAAFLAARGDFYDGIGAYVPIGFTGVSIDLLTTGTIVSNNLAQRIASAQSAGDRIKLKTIVIEGDWTGYDDAALIDMVLNCDSGIYGVENPNVSSSNIDGESSERTVYTTLHRLPNGVTDSVYRGGDNVWYKYKRIEEYALQSADITSLYTGTNIDAPVIALSVFDGLAAQFNGVIDGSFVIVGYSSETENVDNDIDYCFVTTVSNLYLQVPIGTYASLAEAQADLVGAELIYELATPVLEEAEISKEAFEMLTTVYNTSDTFNAELELTYPTNLAGHLDSLTKYAQESSL